MSPAPESDASAGQRRPRPEVQARIIDATLELLLELTPADLVTAIGTRAIAERSGLSRPTIFHQFGSVTALADAVVARVFAPASIPVSAIAAGLESIKNAGLPVEAADLFHRADFRRLTSDPGLRLRMGLWSLGAGSTDAAYGEFLRITDGRLSEFLRPLWEHWGREVRPPFDTDRLIAAQVGLLNGLSIRHLVDPDLSSEDNFALAASALTMVTLRARGDRHDLADRLAEMNYYPLRSSRTGRPLTGRTARTRSALMTAAAELFGVHGYDETTVAQISRRAGVAVSNVYRQFGGKAGLASALFRKQANDAWSFRSTSADTPVGTPTEQLVDHLHAVAEFIGSHSGHARPYLVELLATKPELDRDLETDLVLDATTTLIAACPHAEDEDPLDLAATVLGLLIARVLARPSESGDDHVARVLRRTGLDGLVHSPADGSHR